MSFKYDVFISYKTEETWVPKWLEPELVRAGLRVFMDTGAIEPGDDIKESIDENLPKSRKVLFVYTPDWFASKWTRYECEMALGLAAGPEKVIPLMLRESRDLLGELANLKYIDFVKDNKSQERLAELLAAIGGVKPKPFGLSSFGAQESQLFERHLGRDAEVKDVLAAIQRSDHRAVLLHGESGSGKSSLIQAGVLPQISDPRLFPLEFPVDGIDSGHWVEEIRRQLPAGFSDHGQDLAGLFMECRQKGRLPLLILDQFESIYELPPADRQQALSFVRTRLIDGTRRLLGERDGMLLLGLRSEYFSQVFDKYDDNLKLFPPMADIESIRVRRLKPEDAAEAAYQLSRRRFSRITVDGLIRILSDKEGRPRTPQVQAVCEHPMGDAGRQQSRAVAPRGGRPRERGQTRSR